MIIKKLLFSRPCRFLLNLCRRYETSPTLRLAFELLRAMNHNGQCNMEVSVGSDFYCEVFKLVCGRNTRCLYRNESGDQGLYYYITRRPFFDRTNLPVFCFHN
jgi:hypothetical protein